MSRNIYIQWLAAKVQEFRHPRAYPAGVKPVGFSTAGLARQFIPYWESGQHIEVEFVSEDGEVYDTERGTVGVTTGWKPVFILMRTKRSQGSSYILGHRDRVKGVVSHV